MRIPREVLTACLLVLGCIAVPGQRAQNRAGEQDILSIQNLITENKNEEAQRLLDSLALRYPGDPGLDNLQGVLSAQAGDFSKAEQYFTRAIQHDRRLVSAHLNLGRLYESGATKVPDASAKALREYDTALTFDPDNAEANYQSAVLLMSQSRYRESATRLSRLGPEEKRSAQVLSAELSDASGEKHTAQADTYSTQLLAAPDFGADDLRQATQGLLKGKRSDLFIHLLVALKSKGALPDDLLAALGNCYLQAGSLKEARATFEELYERNNSALLPLLGLAEVAHQQQDFRGALGYLAHAQDIDPKNAGIHYSFGLACLDLNLLGEAQKSFQKAIELNPENAEYNYALGMTTSYMHEPGEGIPYLRKFMQLRPDDPNAVLALGIVYFRAKDLESALPLLDKAAAIPSVAATAHYYLGSVATLQSRPEDAIRELHLAIRDNPDYADAFAELGQTYLSQKDYGAAEVEFDKALRVAPDHYSANFGLLTVYIRTKNAKRAEQAERFEAVQKLNEQKKQEYLRIVEARPIPDAK